LARGHVLVDVDRRQIGAVRADQRAPGGHVARAALGKGGGEVGRLRRALPRPPARGRRRGRPFRRPPARRQGGAAARGWWRSRRPPRPSGVPARAYQAGRAPRPQQAVALAHGLFIGQHILGMVGQEAHGHAVEKRRRPSAPSIQSRSCAGTSQTMRIRRARATCGPVCRRSGRLRGASGSAVSSTSWPRPDRRGRAHLPADGLGAADDLLGRGAAQAPPGREERNRLHQVGLARAVGAEKRHGTAIEIEPRAPVAAEMRQAQMGDMRGHGAFSSGKTSGKSRLSRDEKRAVQFRKSRDFRPVTRASASRRRSRSGRRLPASASARRGRRT
jgi:hypothetical protein